MEDHVERALSAAARAIGDADALLTTAGAGMGVDSGLPDFRGNEGFWKAYPPLARLGVSFVDMANPQWFNRDPELAWGFYGHRLNLYRATLPHAGFAILRSLGTGRPGGSFVFTSNVDGQFQAAGFEDDQVLECHGSIHYMQCSTPCDDTIWEGDGVEVSVDEDTFRASAPLPVCPACGAVARPNILMFGDWSWLPVRSHAQDGRFRAWLDQVRGRSLVVIELGAGTAVPTVRLASESVASRQGATLIRINLREPRVPHGHIGLAMPALAALTAIDEML